VFGKLQLKDQQDVVILDAPDSFGAELKALKGVRIQRKFSGPATFSLAFMTTPAQLKRYAASIGKHATGDAAVWVAYPKGSSKRYKSELHRDGGWQPLGALGYEPVRMIAIDEDWSALRFRKADFIKTMKRSAQHAISRTGKAKAGGAREVSARKSSMQNAASPAAYLASLKGWTKSLATSLRRAVRAAAPLEERMKWGHLVYSANGPVCLIRAESERVLFGFWRGQSLRHIEPRLKPGGKYEMATLQLQEGDKIAGVVVRQLVTEAVALNARLGDPADLS
ncbi:MAG TPA: DUF1801 domain-containing protein, partial [Steroidobacteraceae bacterium]|nr:DUF1801 domain-containing protein [Steroidobacteraceae bacterium]